MNQANTITSHVAHQLANRIINRWHPPHMELCVACARAHLNSSARQWTQDRNDHALQMGCLDSLRYILPMNDPVLVALNSIANEPPEHEADR